MIEGLLGNVGGAIGSAFGGASDFLLNRGRYAEPGAMNAQYGVPEADVRQAGINTLANVSALLLAAGQPMTGAQRGQMLAQIGPAMGGMTTDLFKSSQARLMLAQQREKMNEIAELDAIDKKRKEDPEGLARAMNNIPVDLVKTLDRKTLRDMAKAINIKRATRSPLEEAQEKIMLQALQQSGMLASSGISGAQQPVVAGAPMEAAQAQEAADIAGWEGAQPQKAAAPSAAPAAAQPVANLQSDEQRQKYIASLKDFAARIAVVDPAKAKQLTDAADAIESQSLKKAKEKIGELEGAAAVNAPKSVAFAEETLRLIQGLKNNPGLQYVTGNIYGRGPMIASYVPGAGADQARQAKSVIEQLQSRTFLEAYQNALKGAGPITQVEGIKGEQAIARLNQTYVSTEDYKKALEDLESVLKKTMASATEIGQRYGTIPKQAGAQATPAAPQAGGGQRIRRWNPETGKLE